MQKFSSYIIVDHIAWPLVDGALLVVPKYYHIYTLVISDWVCAFYFFSQVAGGFIPEVFGWFFYKLLQQIQGVKPCTKAQQAKLAAAGLVGSPHWPQVSEKLLRQMARAAESSIPLVTGGSSSSSSGGGGGGNRTGSVTTAGGTQVHTLRTGVEGTDSSSSRRSVGDGSSGCDGLSGGGEDAEWDGEVIELPAWVPPAWIS
jgi:hypothetical protein